MRADNRSERAASTVLVATVVLCATAVAVELATVGGSSLNAARASSVADVSALAGTSGGPVAAEAVARANDARVESIDLQGQVTVVRVERRGSEGIAAARMTMPGSRWNR